MVSSTGNSLVTHLECVRVRAVLSGVPIGTGGISASGGRGGLIMSRPIASCKGLEIAAHRHRHERPLSLPANIGEWPLFLGGPQGCAILLELVGFESWLLVLAISIQHGTASR